MLSVPALTLLLVSFAFAAPQAEGGEICAPIGWPNPWTADYDDLPFTELPPTPVGTYRGLTYDLFYVNTDENLIAEVSPPNHAISFDCTKPRTISVENPGESFDLQSLYVACSSGFPQDDCHIKLRGIKKRGGHVERKIIYPKLENPTPFKMLKVDFGGGWKDLTSLDFTSVEIDGTCNYTGLMIDSLTYKKKKCI
ncbi:hypothetical protein P152DRAFT_460090 [Eremomyces bilateralis CBS 781.70]|uniref:Uncharacterized protein n=1 Tax=Eremomyces bilateralis CBS 781.70 TaxID=1392243 RepID=A0A6G1FZ13_9PEZI|nr:uncharacterized protein P152DRAFT_460090 [Eremomyces bilateralis CBS 781.70]KAF1810799.1 hypothetical protein P152DRAFT_460090 [Eremomyces bilateralis CBS 781.70]